MVHTTVDLIKLTLFRIPLHNSWKTETARAQK